MYLYYIYLYVRNYSIALLKKVSSSGCSQVRSETLVISNNSKMGTCLSNPHQPWMAAWDCSILGHILLMEQNPTQTLMVILQILPSSKSNFFSLNYFFGTVRHSGILFLNIILILYTYFQHFHQGYLNESWFFMQCRSQYYIYIFEYTIEAQ